MNNHFYAVIMAGGGGTRLWPLSRQNRPKQMLRLFGERTLFQIAVDRIRDLFPPERILVVTVAEQAAELQNSRPEIPPGNYLIEPMPRGTASVIGLAAVALRARDPQSIMAILTADHYIENEDLFRRLLDSGRQVAEDGHLVTLGIEPTYPATGYGYIQQGQVLGQALDFPAYQVLRFREKPDEASAREMLSSGEFSWNSGMFIWRSDRILDEFKKHMPDLNAGLERIAEGWSTPAREETIQIVWPGIKPETIDYGIMERAEQVAVIPATGLGWNDVGSWDTLFDVIPQKADGNIVLDANHLAIDTHGVLVYGADPGKIIVTIGVKDLIIIDTGDALLVCDKSQAQNVKQVVNQLKAAGDNQYL
jgi:mannose-1-phosphate guanylyltransferase